VNAITNNIYVVNGDGTVTIINGATSATTTLLSGGNAQAIAVNQVSNKIYVVNNSDNTVTMIDGSTNTIAKVNTGNFPLAVAVNPVANKAYVVNGSDNSVTEITEQQVQANQLVTNIDPLLDNQTVTSTPTFNLTAFSSFYPTNPTPQAIRYQLDTWQGPWLAALGTAPYFTLTTPGLPLGNHILYAFATDGQDANSTGVAQQFIGSMAAYLFTVTMPGTATALNSTPNPSNLGESVTFTATVTVTPPGGGTPTGSVTFYDGTTTLGGVALPSSGQAVYATSALTLGSHSITATYSGDANFLGSTSPVLTQQVNGSTLTVSPTSLSFGNQVINETSAAKTVTLTNTGATSVTISSITVSANFAISSSTCGATLAAGAKCKVGVTFTPTVLGAVAGTLTFNDNAENSPQTVALSGTGIAPAALTPASATYVAQKVGTTSAAKTFTLTNNQTVALTGIAISTTGDFAVSAKTCGTSLAAKGKCTISVTFTPTQTGTRTGQLSVSDSASNSPQTSALKGTGK